MLDLIIKNGKCYIDGELKSVDVAVKDGKIHQIGQISEDAKEFLQNLISNDINKVSDVNSCFTSLLTPQGKFLYEFIIIKHKSG